MFKADIFLRAPAFADPYKNLAASQIFTIVRAFVPSSLFLQIVQIALAPRITGRWLGLLLATVAVSLALLQLTRRGRVRLAAYLLVASLWLLIGIFSWTASGLGARAAWGYFIVVFIAGMLLGRWLGLVAVGICSISTLVIALMGPIVSPDPVRFWLINTLYLLIVLLLQNLANRSVTQSLQKAYNELREREQAETALQERENMLGSIFRAAPIGIGVVRDRVLTWVNSRICEITGWTQEELIGKSSRILYPNDAEFEFVGKEKYRQIAERGTGTVETHWQGRDGRIIDVLLSSTPINPLDQSVGVTFTALDITERKRAEETRFEALARFSGFSEASQYGMGMADLQGNILYANPTLVRMLGEQAAADCLGKHFPTAYYPQAMTRKLQEEVLPAILRDGHWQGELELRTANGRSLPTDENYFLIRDEHGQPSYLADILTDISERKLAEEALLDKNRFISSLLRAIPVAVFFKDREGKYTGCNDAFTEILGVTSDEIKGKTVHEIWPSELAETYHRKDLELMKEKKHQVYEFQVKDKNGELRPVIYAKDVFFDANGEVNGLVGAFLDISHRKRAEEKLLESERRYRTLFESAGDAIFLLHGHRIVDCNSRTQEMFGCARDQIIGLPISRFHPLRQPDGSDSLVKGREKSAAAQNGDPQFFAWRHVRFDGSSFDAEVSLIRVELGSGLHLLAMIRDISERKKLEEQLRQAQKMEAIGILAGGVAHDFNNILSTIVGYGSLLQMKLPADGPLKEYVERILAATERAANLTNSLLAFSRKQEIELLPLDINDAIYGFHKVLARLIGEDIDFHLELASQTLVVDADVRQVEQVLMNLANNSRDAMPRGGKLTIATAAAILGEALGEIPAGSYAVITVADTGAGMGQDVQAHIFEPFFTTKEVGKGTGLGLAMVYGIVKKHNAYIHVASAPGQGTVFSIYLPLNTRLVKKTARRKPDKIPAGSETILLVEDDAAVRHATRSMLEEFGYTVLAAADGVEAKALFKQYRDEVRLVLCDLIMPKMNGRQTFAAIQKIRSDIKGIFMSGYTADFIADKGIAGAGVPLLLKPLNPGVLLKKIRAVLDEQ